MPNILVEGADLKSTRNAGLAPFLSLLPGLGQVYNGQARKGLLFLATTASYLFVFVLMAFNRSLIEGLNGFGHSVHMSPNPGLLAILSELHLGSTLSFIVIGLFLGFVVCAMKDASEYAILLQRKHIYPDQTLEINEAASGSYLLHFIAIVFLFVLTIFFYKQSQPVSHITYIEFAPSQIVTKKVIDAPYKSDRPSPSSGTRKKQPIAPSSSKQGSTSIAKTMQEPKKDIAVPKPIFRPLMALTNNKIQSPPVPQQRNTADLIRPPLPNSNTSTTTAPHPIPQSMSKAVDLPKPSLINKDKTGQSLIPPKLLNSSTTDSASTNSKNPVPVSANSINNFAPVPEKIGSRSSAANSSNNSLTKVGPTKVANFAGITPGVRVRPSLGSPAIPTVGGQRAIGDDSHGNPLDNATPGADSLPAAPVDFGPYMADLQRRIKQNWFPPKDPASKRIVVIFKIHRHGELTDLRIERSSGLSTTDQAALKAVENAAPFRPLPAGASENADIQFTFDYNVFSGGNASLFKRF